MTVTRIPSLRCDHRSEDVPAGAEGGPTYAGPCERLFIPGGEGLPLPALRELAANRGWRRYVTSSRHEYDLCPEHYHRRPDVDFPHWKADRSDELAGANGPG